MMLCRNCILRASRTLRSRHSARASSTIREIARQEPNRQYIIHEVPKSTRKPPPAKYKKRAPELQRKLFEQYQSALGQRNTTVSAVANTGSAESDKFEFMLELDLRAKQWRNRTIGKGEYDKLVQDIDTSFTTNQLLKYLSLSKVPFDIRKGKPHKIHRIVQEYWKVEIGMAAESTTVSLVIPRKHLFFLLLNNGEFLGHLSSKYDARIELQDSTSTLVISIDPRFRSSTRTHYMKQIKLQIEQVARAIKTKEFVLPNLNVPLSVKTNVMKMTNVYIEHVDNILRLSYNGADSAWEAALRYMLSYPQFADGAEPLMRLQDKSLHTCDSPVKFDPLLLAKTVQTWTRQTAAATGVYIPFYITSVRVPRPIFGHQVLGRHEAKELQSSDLLDDGSSLASHFRTHMLHATPDQYVDRVVEVSFGYALNGHSIAAESADPKRAIRSFSSDIPGLEQLLKVLVPRAEQVERKQVLRFMQEPAKPTYVVTDTTEDRAIVDEHKASDTSRANASEAHELCLTIFLPDHQESEFKTTEIPVYTVETSASNLETVIALPNHHADIRISSKCCNSETTGRSLDDDLSVKRAISDFLDAGEFQPSTKSNTYPATLTIGSQSWFLVGSEVTRSLMFEPIIDPTIPFDKSVANEVQELEGPSSNDTETSRDQQDNPNNSRGISIRWDVTKRLDRLVKSGPSTQELKIITKMGHGLLAADEVDQRLQATSDLVTQVMRTLDNAL